VRTALTIFMLWAAGLGSAAQFGKVSVAYDQIAAAYPGHGAVGIGLVVSIVGIVGLIFGTTAGLLVARIGPRRAIVAALVMGAVVSAVQTLMPPYPLMLVLRGIEGFSHLAIVVVGPTMIAGLAPPRHQGLAMTLWSSFFGVTYAILALIGPGILAAGGIAALFFGHAVWMAALALILRLLLPPDPRAPILPGQGNLVKQHADIYASPRIAAPAMGFVCYAGLYVALLTLLPPLMPPDLRATVGAGMPLVSIIVSLTAGVWLLSRVTAVHLVQGGFAIATLATAALWAVWGQGAAMVAASFAIAAALGIVQGASFASIPQLNATGPDRARAAGAVAQLGNLGTTSGTPLLAYILTQSGPSGIAAFAIPLCLLGITIHAVQARRRLYR
jgi:DHA1 family inner membrane transport protein